MIALIAPAVLLLQAASAFAATFSVTPEPYSDFYTATFHMGSCVGSPTNGVKFFNFFPDGNFDADVPFGGFDCLQLPIDVTGLDWGTSPFPAGINHIVVGYNENIQSSCYGQTYTDCLAAINQSDPDFYNYSFTVEAPPIAANVINVPTNLATDLSQNTGDQLSDNGTLAVLSVVAGAYIVFYVIRELVGLSPKKGAKR
jgi:hypothetical protein